MGSAWSMPAKAGPALVPYLFTPFSTTLVPRQHRPRSGLGLEIHAAAWGSRHLLARFRNHGFELVVAAGIEMHCKGERTLAELATNVGATESRPRPVEDGRLFNVMGWAAAKVGRQCHSPTCGGTGSRSRRSESGGSLRRQPSAEGFRSLLGAPGRRCRQPRNGRGFWRDDLMVDSTDLANGRGDYDGRREAGQAHQARS